MPSKVDVALGKEKATWGAVIADFLERGLDPRQIRLVVSDERRGLQDALIPYFTRAILQRI
ncbi:transposase [Chloroflexota bacterium]